MNVGDVLAVGGRKVTVVTVEPDVNGEIVVKNDGGYYVPIHPDRLDPPRATWRGVHPDLGQFTVDLPIDGNPEQRVVWSQAATDAATKG